MRNTIILAVIAIALAAYVYFVEIKGGQQRQKEKEIAGKLFNVKKDSIDHIIIQKPNQTFEFVKKDNTWQIVQPIQTLADDSPINSVLYSLSSTKKIRTFKTSPKDLPTYGLADQSIKVTFSGHGVAEQWLKIGDRTPVGGNVFVTKDDSNVVIVSSSIKNTMDKSLFQWRDKRAIHFTKEQIREIVLKNPHGKFHFVKEGEDWMLTEPVKTKGDNPPINSILNKLEYGRVKAVAAESAKNLAKYRLKHPAFRIELFTGQEKAKLGVSFSNVKNNTAYGKDDVRPHIFEVDSFFVKPFNKTLYDYRNKKVAKFNRDQAHRIKLIHHGQLMIVEKDTSDNWVFSTGEQAKKYKITNLLSALSNLKAQRFVEEHPKNLKKYKLAPAKSSITVYDKDGQKIIKLLVGKDRDDDEVYAKVSGQPPVVTFKKRDLKKVFLKKDDLIVQPKKSENEATQNKNEQKSEKK